MTLTLQLFKYSTDAQGNFECERERAFRIQALVLYNIFSVFYIERQFAEVQIRLKCKSGLSNFIHFDKIQCIYYDIIGYHIPQIRPDSASVFLLYHTNPITLQTLHKLCVQLGQMHASI